jgi:uncharacterized membrane protein YeiH
MSDFNLFHALDLVGTIAFAISGALTAINKKLDAFGVLIIAFVTAVGGGTLCDVLIGRTPVGWMNHLEYVYLIGLGYLIAILFRKKPDTLTVVLFIFDTIGLGVFTIIGIEKGVHLGLSPLVCIALGTITPCFGGVIRDVLCTEIPVIFRQEIYATACILGGIVFFLMKYLSLNMTLNLNTHAIYAVTCLVIIATRLIVTRFDLHLPTPKQH